jgi:hypothetical protein
MVSSAPRLDSRLIAAVRRLDDGKRPIAEIHRRLGAVAGELGLAQPSYQRVRLLVRDLRVGRAVPGIGDVLLDIALQNRPPEALIEHLADHPRRTLQHCVAKSEEAPELEAVEGAGSSAFALEEDDEREADREIDDADRDLLSEQAADGGKIGAGRDEPGGLDAVRERDDLRKPAHSLREPVERHVGSRDAQEAAGDDVGEEADRPSAQPERADAEAEAGGR